ncbi:efflux transporter outer membrane subunit [Hyphococcus flavus]|uniref:Efflux transporter outer membrane subunit n=1 Tax=Hyphococcus flavus TaxID=1866326 RepID=A0AAE9ZCZ1_9PROT|nr:efflux transporter outer membrane subunit [Hyphococcus flavus]WDI30182.1 efflux transporter outer membrane subunit [Hyphococcus flavus]
MKRMVLLLTCTALTACATPQTSVSGLTEMPLAYDHVDQQGDPISAQWWRAFADPKLDALVNEALAANQDIIAGIARVRQSRASVKSSNASLFPTINGGASASSNSESDFGDISTSGRLSASYQLDIFGQNQADRAAAHAGYDAQVFTQKGLELTVQSDVAFNYFSILTLRERLDTARSNLTISERIYDIIKVRYDAGDVSGFDVSSQEASLANARARIPQLEQQLVSFETALAVLLGRTPQGYDAPEGDILALTPPSIDPGLPADLLLRRPDLLSAEASLRGADAGVAAAQRAFLPSIDLSAGLSAAPLTGGTNIIGSLASSLAAPIFSGGRLEAGLDSAEARVDEQVARYRQATLAALRDVEVSLSGLATAEQREDQLEVAYAAAERSLELSEARYRAGTDNLTSLLNAQSTFFNASDSLAQGRLDRLTAATDLFVALGGGWAAENNRLASSQ